MISLFNEAVNRVVFMLSPTFLFSVHKSLPRATFGV